MKCPDEFMDSLFSKEMFDTILKCQLLFLNRTIRKNKEAPDFAFYRLNGDSFNEVTMKSVQRPGVPLVINFGSNSWPPFVADTATFSELAQKYGEKADFIFIYIEEAHPIGEWEFKVRCGKMVVVRKL